MQAYELIQSTVALAGLAVLMHVCYQLKRSLIAFAKTGSFR